MAHLTRSQFEHFDTEGYLILRGFFAADHVQQLRQRASAVLRRAKRGDEGVHGDPLDDHSGDDLNPARIIYVNDIHLHDELLDAHMRDAKLLAVLSELIGNNIDAFQACTVTKPARIDFDYHGWHQDAADYGDLSNMNNIATITYLCEVAPNEGSTSLVPRSHRAPLLEQKRTEIPGKPIQQRSLVGFEKYAPDAITPTFAAGDVLVFSSWIMHRANSNTTSQSKIGLINVYQSDDCMMQAKGPSYDAIGLPLMRSGRVLSKDESTRLRQSTPHTSG